ncbi:MAG: phosphatase domain-containing protein [Bacteroidota bacterium]
MTKKQQHQKIKIYKSFGSPKEAYIFGHLFTKTRVREEKVSSNIFKNAWEMIKRYRISTIPNRSVVVKVEHEEYTVKTDDKGYFFLSIKPDSGKSEIVFSVTLADNPQISESGILEIREPNQIIISDIDDTIIVSHSTSLIRKIYTLLSRNFQRRKPFEGVHEFYHQLSASKPNEMFFYVSSSEWNLYDFIDNFCTHNHFPSGVFLLNDIKTGLLQLLKSGGGSHTHKLEKIRLIKETYTNARLTLIGDSGQKDVEIYEKIALEDPDRIEEIYIRDLHKSKTNTLLKKRSELAELKINMHLFN